MSESDQAYDNAAAEAVKEPAEIVSESPETGDAGNQGAEVKDSQAPTWNGEEYAFESKGQRIVPKDRNELIAWANRGRDYSQRVHELKQKAAEMQKQEQEYGQYKQLAQAFESNPQFKQQILDLYAKSQNQTATPQEEAKLAQLPPEIQAKLAEVDNLKGEFEQIKREKEDQLLESEITALKGKYKADWDTDLGEGTLIHKVMQKAIDTGLSLDDCYKLLNYDTIRTATEAETKKAMAVKMQDDQKKGIVSSAYGQKPTAPKLDHSKMNWNKLAEAAISEMR